jgi:MipA family protein
MSGVTSCYTCAVKRLFDKRCHLRYWLLLLCGLSIRLQAETALPCADVAHCVTEQQLYLSVALGYGQRSNPLHGGDDLPLVLLPDIYYYTEKWFFDNGKLGTSWTLTEDCHLSLVGQLNQEKSYFQKWFSGSAFQFNQSIINASFKGELSGPAQASVREVSKRPTAFDLGLQLDWFHADWQLQSILWQDISNTYQGQHASLSASRGWQTALGRWQLQARLHWKSAKLIDTYYGIDDDQVFYLPRYKGKPSWQPELRLSWQQPLTEHIALLAFVRYLYLDNAMTDSPLVHSDNVTTWFFGVSYRLY